MLLSVRLIQNRGTALMIPEAALLQQGEQSYVYVAGPDHKARRTDVTVGRQRAGFIEITAGLNSGAQVITDGSDRLRPNAPIRVQTATPARAPDYDAARQRAPRRGSSQ